MKAIELFDAIKTKLTPEMANEPFIVFNNKTKYGVLNMGVIIKDNETYLNLGVIPLTNQDNVLTNKTMFNLIMSNITNTDTLTNTTVSVMNITTDDSTLSLNVELTKGYNLKCKFDVPQKKEIIRPMYRIIPTSVEFDEKLRKIAQDINLNTAFSDTENAKDVIDNYRKELGLSSMFTIAFEKTPCGKSMPCVYVFDIKPDGTTYEVKYDDGGLYIEK